MVLPARRLTALKTWRGPTRSSSSTGGTTTTMIRRPEGGRREFCFATAEAMCPVTMPTSRFVRKRNEQNGGFRSLSVGNRLFLLRYHVKQVSAISFARIEERSKAHDAIRCSVRDRTTRRRRHHPGLPLSRSSWP